MAAVRVGRSAGNERLIHGDWINTADRDAVDSGPILGYLERGVQFDPGVGDPVDYTA